MLDRLDYLNTFMRENEYPKEAVECLGQNYHKICLNSEAAYIFEQTLRFYESDKVFDYGNWLKKMGKVAEICEIPVESATLLLVLSMSKHLKEKYELHGIDLQIYKDSCMDFKAKLLECKKNKDIWGTYVGPWFNRWFDLTRFALGRLQFEIAYAWCTVEGTYKTVNAGQAVVNMHIPSLGPLIYEDCRESFIRAYEFFKPYFPDEIVPFFCASWIISPSHEAMLGSGSNLRKFMTFFKIREGEGTVEKALNDYVFGPADLTDVDALPENTSMQRAYKEVLKKGEMPHIGAGVFHMKDGKFI